MYLLGLHFDKLGNSMAFFFAISGEFQHLANIEHIQKMLIYDIDLKTSYDIFHYLFGIRLCSMVAKCLGFVT